MRITFLLAIGPLLYLWGAALQLQVAAVHLGYNFARHLKVLLWRTPFKEGLKYPPIF
ncbi:hypothetical protein [Pseudomonas fontis]|uniref:Uncharacterized protein n=1 Tax=Pseudomonas fontis TaxID=2942633 RepID=A0ABT5NYA8_9PSED|nr:hypothetical protein [Pseudomonas fontis]MDD0976451.1 hypothetical protein [Pseudomonas fontis]MDD0993112.1 hypothetical protein [Pseudomonas fontis]